MKKNIRTVVLNACFSEEQAQSISEEIDCVVGMTDEVGDQAAIVFAANFYRALGFGESVQSAFSQAVTAIKLQNIPGAATPKVFVKTGINADQVRFAVPA